MKKVCIRWRDSLSMHGWQKKSVVDRFFKDGPDIMESVGFLYKKSKDCIVIVQSHHKECKNYGETLLIPRECIVSIKKI